MDFSEWNSLLLDCVKLGLSVHMDGGGGRMSPQFFLSTWTGAAVGCLPNLTPIRKLLSVYLVFNADGNFTVTHSFINYFSIPSIGQKTQ